MDLVTRELARKHTAFNNIGFSEPPPRGGLDLVTNRKGAIGFSEAKGMFKLELARKWGHAIARGWATPLLDRLGDVVVAPFSGGGNSSPLHDSQGVDELATSDRYHHFHGQSAMPLIFTGNTKKHFFFRKVAE